MSVPTLHDRFDVLRFPLIVLVIYVHDAFGVFETGISDPHVTGSALLFWGSQFWSHGIGGIAVPLFFLMSGYLFFRGTDWGPEVYRNKLQRRFWSLLLPYLFWNIALFALLYTAQAFGAFGSANIQFTSRSTWENTAHILGFTQYPVAFQFWFIRDLILLVLFAPAIRWAVQALGLWLIIPLFAIWMSGTWPVAIPNIEALLFFSTGSYLAVRNRSPFPATVRETVIACSVSLILLAVTSLSLTPPLMMAFHKAGVALGVFGALGLSAFLASAQPMRKILLALAPASFFVFAMHEPLQRVVRDVTYTVLPDGGIAQLALYIGLPLLVAAVGALGYFIGKRLLPGLTDLVSGNGMRAAMKGRPVHAG